MGNPEKLNPDIKDWDYGVRETRTIQVYPLSIYDQKQLTEGLVEVIAKFTSGIDAKDMADEEAIMIMRDLITDNIETILTYITVEDERPKLNEITNNQLYQLIEIVFSVNYEGIVKNVRNLFNRMSETVKTRS